MCGVTKPKSSHKNLMYLKKAKRLFLVRLEFEIKLEPLLLYSPPPATPAAATPPPVLFNFDLC